MGIGCGASLAKLILFIFNFVFFVSGAAILGVGIWLKVDPNALSYLKVIEVNQNDKLIQVAIIVLICVGAFIFLVGFLGCCGACKESPCLLCLYAFLLVGVLILLVTAGILAAVFRGKIDSYLQKDMYKQVTTMYKYLKGNERHALTDAWNAMQYGLKCCGSTNATNYYLSNWYNASIAANVNNTRRLVPKTCCMPMDPNKMDPKHPIPRNETACYIHAAMNPPPANSTYLYTQGCHPQLRSWFIKYSSIILGIAFGLFIIQIVGICLACCLRSAIKNEQ